MSKRPEVDFTSIIKNSEIPTTEAAFETLLKKEVIGDQVNYFVKSSSYHMP